MLIESTFASVYAIFVLVALAIKASALKAKETSQTGELEPVPAPAPAPEPVCFPIAPVPQPRPTFSGPVVLVTTNAQFIAAVAALVSGTTIILDGSQGIAYQLASTTTIGVSVRITSLNPQQPAVITQRSGGSGTLQSCLFFQNVTGDPSVANILIDNVVISNAIGSTSALANSIGLRFTNCNGTTTVGSNLVNTVFVDNVRFFARQRCIETLTCGIQVTNCFFGYNITNLSTNDSVRRTSLSNIVRDVMFDGNTFQSLTLSDNSNYSVPVAIVSESGFAATNAANITIQNTKQVGTYPFLRLFQQTSSSSSVPSQPFYKLYLYNNNVYTVFFINCLQSLTFANDFDVVAVKNCRVRVIERTFSNPAVQFASSGSNQLYTNFSTKFFFDNFVVDNNASFVPYIETFNQPMFSNLPLSNAGFQKSTFQLIQGQYTAQFSIPCDGPQP